MTTDFLGYDVFIVGSHIASAPPSKQYIFGYKRSESIVALLSMVTDVSRRDWHQTGRWRGSCMCCQGLAEVSLASVGCHGHGVALLCCCVAAVMAGDGHFCCSLTHGKRRAIPLRLVGTTA
eukprot:scaffold9359_cov49-Cyclotella_meneghiniana.AAC.1